MPEQLNFGEAIQKLKDGCTVTRLGWGNADVKVRLQVPDEHSKMTEPYLYMVKNEGKTVFPLDLSCESILAEDWVTTT